MVELINIPFIYSLQFSYEKVIERLCAGLLMLSSHIPDVTSRLTDSMTFIQRLENWLLYTMSDVISAHYSFPEWNEYYSKFLGKRNLHAIIILISYV